MAFLVTVITNNYKYIFFSYFKYNCTNFIDVSGRNTKICFCLGPILVIVVFFLFSSFFIKNPTLFKVQEIV